MTHRNKKGKFQAIRKEIRKNSAAEKHENTTDQKKTQKEEIKDDCGKQQHSKKRNVEKDKIQNCNSHTKKGTDVIKVDSAENIPTKTKKTDKSSQVSKKSDTYMYTNPNLFTTTSPRGKMIADVLLQRLPNGAIELPHKLCSVIGDVDKMKPFFVRDPKTGKSLVDPNARRVQDGSTVLQLAIKSRNSAAVKLLLDNGADCSLADYMGDNAVMLAIKEGEATVINQLWPHRGALDVNHANIFGITALHLAADRKWEGCVNFLIQNGANTNATSTSGTTPLMFAANKGAVKIVDLLLKAGADVLRVDNEFDTCVSRAPLESNREVVEHILGHIGDVQKEQFLGLTMDLLQRKPPPTDINHVLVNKFLPLMEECTRLPGYREAFYRKNVVRFLNVNMSHNIQSLEAATLASHIVFCVMFRFDKDAVDQGFVYQFLECKGPDNVFSLITRLKAVFKISHKETMLFFLPVLGLSEVPAGRIWLERNNLLVSEYLGYFERDSLKVYLAPLTCRHWCMEADRFPLVDRTWKRFYDIVNRFAAKQRQKNMLELLRDEELEKTRKAKKKEKVKNAPKTEPNSQRNHTNIDYETIFGYPLETDEVEKRSFQLDNDYKIISDMFCGVSPPTCSNENAATIDADQHNTNSNGVPSTLKASAPVVVSNVSVQQDEWTTVQGKKMTKDKIDEKQTNRVESPTKQPRFPKKDATPSKKLNQRKPQNARPAAVVFTQDCKPLSTPVSGVHRWADVAKGLGKTKCEEVKKNTNDALPANSETHGTFMNQDFPSLDGYPEQKEDVSATRTRPTKMTFAFHEPNDICSVDLMSQPAASPLSFGDMIEQELNECAAGMVEFPQPASPTVDNDSPIYNQKIQAPVSQDDRYIGDEVMSVECFMYDPEYIETPDSELARDSIKLTDSPTLRCHGGSPDQTMGTKWLEELSVTDDDLSSDDDASEILDELAHAVTREIEEDAENEIIKIMERNQRESFDQFEKVALEERESAAFISLPPSPKNVLSARNAIDALFEIPGYIPQSFESDEEDDKISVFSVSASSTPDPDRTMWSNSIGPSPENIQVVQSKPKLGSYMLESLNNACKSTKTCLDSRTGDTTSPGPIARPKAPSDGMSGKVKCQPREDTHITSPPKSAFKAPLKTIGQQILQNVQRLDQATTMQIPDEVEVPSDLGGVPLIEGDTKRNEDIPNASEHFFPSFHETPKQTSNMFDSGYSLFQELHMHRKNLREFYEQNKLDIMENRGDKRNQFIFYAQHIGLNHDEIKQYLMDCITDTQSRNSSVPRQSDLHDCPLPFPRQQTQNGIPTQNKYPSNQFPSVPQPVHYTFGNQTIIRPTIAFTPAPTQNVRAQNNATPENTGNNCNNEDQLRNNRPQPIHRPTGLVRAQLQSKQPGLVNSMGQRSNLDSHPNAGGSQTMPSGQPPVFHEKRAGPVSQAESYQQWSVDESPHFPKSNTSIPTNSIGMPACTGQSDHQYQEKGHVNPSIWKNLPDEQPNDRMERPFSTVGSYSAMLQAQRNRQPYSNAQPPKRGGDAPTTGQQPNTYQAQDVTPKHILQKDPNQRQVPAATRHPYISMQPPRQFPANKIPSLQTNGALIETCQALYSAKIISVRWRDELARQRELPAQMCMFVNNIVIPAADKDRVYISYHSTGPSILGHLRDGTEVSVRLMQPSAARISPDLANKLLNMDESEHFILKYKDFVYNDGMLYVASELHEYTLTEFLVRDRNVDDTCRQRMLFQLLRGIKRLHQDHLCVHGELRPDNVLLDVNGTVKLAGYGLGRNREGPPVDYSEDDMCWLPPEVLVHKKQVNFKSDIFATGMLIYYILRNCRNPFGNSPAEILRNIEASSPLVEAVPDEAADLLATMLSINKIERPSINNTLDHPCFWGEEKKFRFINIVGSDVVYELKHGLDKRESMIDILCSAQTTTKFDKWMDVIEPHLLRDMTVYRQYKNTLLNLVLFVHNYCAHTDKLSERSQRAVDEPCSYFLSRFPSLFMAVYRAIKRSGKRHKTCYAPFF